MPTIIKGPRIVIDGLASQDDEDLNFMSMTSVANRMTYRLIVL